MKGGEKGAKMRGKRYGKVGFQTHDQNNSNLHLYILAYIYTQYICYLYKMR